MTERVTTGTTESGFVSSAERIQTERKIRENNQAKALSFGVSFLDDVFLGLLPHDVMLLGARTGSGKTQLATVIADANITRGKRVHYFALEGEPSEIEMRIKYRALARRASAVLRSKLSFRAWILGRFLADEETRSHESDIEIEAKLAARPMHTYYRGQGDFDIDDLGAKILAIQDETDLIILDHLHYVDYPDEQSENQAHRRIVKRIRDVAICIGKPVIVVAHIRKGDRGSTAIIPTLDDFHGSSDITKIATKAVMLAPAQSGTGQGHLWGTYMQAAKFRLDAGCTRYVARCSYDAIRNTYEETYQLGLAKDGAHEILPLALVPEWAKHNRAPMGGFTMGEYE